MFLLEYERHLLFLANMTIKNNNNIPNVCYVSKFVFLFYIYISTRLNYGSNNKTQKEKFTTKKYLPFEFEHFHC